MIKNLEWDSKFFDASIGNLEEGDYEALFSTKLENFDLVQCCCDISNVKFINEIEKKSFHYIDTRIELKQNISQTNSSGYELASIKDINPLKEIATSVFKESRYNHKLFKKNKSSELYSLWTQKAVLGEFDDLCLIKRSELGEIAGFLTVKFLDKDNCKIGLVGIKEKFQSKGYGAVLMNDLFFLMKEKNIKNVTVITQGTNLSAQKFYIKHGFSPLSIKSWYYHTL